MKRLSLAASALMALAVISGCGSQQPACVNVPTSISNGRLVTTDTRLTVPVNAIVYMALVEPEKYATHPGFPWLAPRTSARNVLAPVRFCKQTAFGGLPESLTAFKALHPGTATLTARLAKGWPGSVKPSLQPALDNVTVR